MTTTSSTPTPPFHHVDAFCDARSRRPRSASGCPSWVGSVPCGAHTASACRCRRYGSPRGDSRHSFRFIADSGMTAGLRRLIAATDGRRMGSSSRAKVSRTDRGRRNLPALRRATPHLPNQERHRHRAGGLANRPVGQHDQRDDRPGSPTTSPNVRFSPLCRAAGGIERLSDEPV